MVEQEPDLSRIRFELQYQLEIDQVVYFDYFDFRIG